jgi:hypothetical protein
MPRARWSACLPTLLALLGACGDDDLASAPLLNRCTQAFECTRDDRCDVQLGICVRDQVERPYSLAVLVIPNEATFTRTSREAPMFLGGSSFDDLRVRRAVPVTGSILDRAGGTFDAEVAFVPRATSLLSEGVSSFTRRAGDSYTFSAALAPDTRYDVRVFPLGQESERLPPRTFTLDTFTASQRIELSYPELEARPAVLLDENGKPPPAGSRLRLRNRMSGEIVSSIGKPSSTEGRFDIDAPSEVFEALGEHELVLEVPYGDAPQSVAIVFDGELLVAGARLTMPVLPTPVLYTFNVEIAGLDDTPPVNADATFVSAFPLPNASGDVRGRDWCRLKLPGSARGTFTCSETVQTSVVGTAGSVRLLPGDYQIYVAPSGGLNDPLRVATFQYPEQITTQDNGAAQGPQAIPLRPAAVYSGRVTSPTGAAMPSVTITANALGSALDLGEIARYNRTAERVSDRRGRFQLAVDTGFYDLVAAQPEGSGFAWVLNYNRRVDLGQEAATMDTMLAITPQTPVIARGTVITEGSASEPARPLSQARVEAYAVVPNLESGENRTVRIASTRTNESGEFALALPPYIGEPPTTSSSVDAGFGRSFDNIGANEGLDAGARDGGPREGTSGLTSARQR